MPLFSINKNREFLKKHIGDMSQIAGMKKYAFIEGKAKGVDAIDIKTGAGLSFTVLPGRGMDLAWAEFNGIPFGYISKTGIVSAGYYESGGMEWLRTFFAGLLTTCGLSNVGGPCKEEHPVLGTQHFGLHGRISNMAAEQVCTSQRWEGDEYIMSVSGLMRESVLHGENLTLRRTITTSLAAQSIWIRDTVENEGVNDQPLMILYHFNIGYPLLDENSVFVCNSRRVTPSGERSVEKNGDYKKMQSPAAGEREHVFFHDFCTDPEGMTCCGIINPVLNMGVYIRYKKTQMPEFTQWKMMSETEYVFGMEPGNCNPVGREQARKDGTLQYLKGGEKRDIEVEIGVLSSAQQIDEFMKNVDSFK